MAVTKNQTARSRLSYEDVMALLKAEGNPKNVAGMARFGISSKNILGISVPFLRSTARRIGMDHSLSLKLWSSGVHEARILASMIDDQTMVTRAQMDQWVADFDSWDVCDQCCGNLFVKTPYAYDKAVEWSKKESEFGKRAGYALMAYLAVHDKSMENDRLGKFLPLITKGSDDDRNLVKKSVNWALRQIGKRNLQLNKMAVQTAREISRLDSKSARWIAADALRELQSDAVKKKLRGG